MNSRLASPIKAVIADDEPLLLEALESELTACMPELQIVERCRTGKHALKVLQSQKVDVAFLDIQMPVMTGLDVAEHCLEESLDQQKAMPLIVFVTAYSEYAVKAFDVAAVDYIVKPISSKRLAETIDRLRARLSQSNIDDQNKTVIESLTTLVTQSAPLMKKRDELQTIKASVGDKTYFIPVEEVILFAASEKYIEVHTADRRVLIRTTIRELIARLAATNFTQIHRSFIVNRSKIKAVQRLDHHKMCLILEGTEEKPQVSRLYQPQFR